MSLIRVNMIDKSISTEPVPDEYFGLGGRGLTSMIISREVPPACDPLGSDNKLIFAPGILSGTPLVNTGRLSIGAKSPLTGGIKESNVGGNASPAMARHGIRALVIEGAAEGDEQYLLKIDSKGRVSLIAADDCIGRRTYALVEKILDEHGEENAVICIGPAGEYKLKSASIQCSDVDGRPCRAAGRGGLGAVMGSKGLKAVIIDRTGRSAEKISDPRGFKKGSRIIAKAIKEDLFSSYVLAPLGTAALVAPINAVGAFPSYNATNGVFDGWEDIAGEKLAETIQERGGKTTHQGCSQCIIHCSNEFVDQKGDYVTSSLEYETIWSMGGMCGINDLDTIARLDFLSDDIGVDSMNTGVALATAMDAGHVRFGDRTAAVEMMEEIASGTEFGKILGNGPAEVGKHFNHHRVAVVKNQSIAAYDPRGIQGMGVTYATSPMGGDHTAANVIDQNLPAFGGRLNPLKPDGQVEYSLKVQKEVAALDSTGLCNFVNSSLGEGSTAEQALLELISVKIGQKFGSEDLKNLGKRILKAEIDFNRRAGLTSKDDRLPRFFYDEPLPPHNKTFLVTDEDLDKALEF